MCLTRRIVSSPGPASPPAAGAAVARGRPGPRDRSRSSCGSGAVAKRSVQRRQDEQREQRRRSTRPPSMTTAIGCTISSPAMSPRTRNGSRIAAVASVAVTSAGSRSRAPAWTSSGRAARSRSSSWTRRQRAAARRGPRSARTATRPAERAERELGAVEQGRQQAAGERDGQRQERRAPPAASCGTRPAAAGTWRRARRGRRRRSRSRRSRCPSSRSGPRRGTRAGSVASRQRARGRRRRRRRGCGRSTSAATSMPPRHRVALDDARRRAHAHVGDVAEPHVAAVRACRSAGCARSSTLRRDRAARPHDDVEDLLLLEEAADLDALQQRRPRRGGRRPA